jgi:hypothetical protein
MDTMLEELMGETEEVARQLDANLKGRIERKGESVPELLAMEHGSPRRNKRNLWVG